MSRVMSSFLLYLHSLFFHFPLILFIFIYLYFLRFFVSNAYLKFRVKRYLGNRWVWSNWLANLCIQYVFCVFSFCCSLGKFKYFLTQNVPNNFCDWLHISVLIDRVRVWWLIYHECWLSLDFRFVYLFRRTYTQHYYNNLFDFDMS